MDVGIGQRDAVERRGRKVKMRTEVFRRRRHFGRSPDIAQPQRIAANGQWSGRHVDTRRKTCALAVIRVLSAGVLHRRYRSRGLLREGETCEGRIALTFEPANLVGGGAVSNRPQFSPSTH
jgi:hypothetical protein